ncbi:MAG TPA: hypothetical protein VLG50_00915 [Candidatus Saccharimonadales bacterium]|nr:hypothetical protein [Candidatus Saccharimonadales bacterium]
MKIKISVMMCLLSGITAQGMSQEEYMGHYRNNCSFICRQLIELATADRPLLPFEQIKYDRLLVVSSAMKCADLALGKKKYTKNEQLRNLKLL